MHTLSVTAHDTGSVFKALSRPITGFPHGCCEPRQFAFELLDEHVLIQYSSLEIRIASGDNDRIFPYVAVLKHFVRDPLEAGMVSDVNETAVLSD
jgi:hypothetical protein